MLAWGGAERLAVLIRRGRALMLAGSGAKLDAAAAERIGLIDQVLPRTSFAEGWPSLAWSLANAPAGEIKRVVTGVTADAAIAAFARLWVADERWAAAD